MYIININRATLQLVLNSINLQMCAYGIAQPIFYIELVCGMSNLILKPKTMFLKVMITCYLLLGLAPCPFERPALAPYPVNQTKQIIFKWYGKQDKGKHTMHSTHTLVNEDTKSHYTPLYLSACTRTHAHTQFTWFRVPGASNNYTVELYIYIYTYSISQRWVHPSHFFKYFIISFHVTTLKKLLFATT